MKSPLARPYIPYMHTTGYASCRVYAEKARLSAARTGDPSLRDHFNEVADMWDQMAASILKSGVDPNAGALGLDVIPGGKSAGGFPNA